VLASIGVKVVPTKDVPELKVSGYVACAAWRCQSVGVHEAG
jgi:hypothetical protein